MEWGSYAKKTWSFLKRRWYASALHSSLKVKRKNFLTAVGVDFAYLTILWFGIIALYTYMGPHLPYLTQAGALLDTMATLPQEKLMEAYAPIQSAFFSVVTSLILFAVLVLILNGFAKTYSWSMIMGRPYSWKLFVGGMIYSLLYILFFCAVMVVILYPLLVAQLSWLFSIAMVLSAFLLFLVLILHRIALVAKVSLLKPISTTYSLIVLRFYRFIIPILVSILVLAGVVMFTRLVIDIPAYIGLILTVFIYLVYLNWAKSYFYQTVRRISFKGLAGGAIASD